MFGLLDKGKIKIICAKIGLLIRSFCFQSNFSNCEILKENIRRIQEQLIDVQTWMAKGGNLANNNQTEFVEIIFEDFTKKPHAEYLLSKKEGQIIQKCQVPSHLDVEVIYSNTSGIFRYIILPNIP